MKHAESTKQMTHYYDIWWITHDKVFRALTFSPAANSFRIPWYNISGLKKVGCLQMFSASAPWSAHSTPLRLGSYWWPGEVESSLCMDSRLHNGWECKSAGVWPIVAPSVWSHGLLVARCRLKMVEVFFSVFFPGWNRLNRRTECPELCGCVMANFGSLEEKLDLWLSQLGALSAFSGHFPDFPAHDLPHSRCGQSPSTFWSWCAGARWET